jgi:hypothetical protein
MYTKIRICAAEENVSGRHLVLLDITVRTHLSSGHDANERWKPPVLLRADHPKAPRVKRLDNECDYTPIDGGQ